MVRSGWKLLAVVALMSLTACAGPAELNSDARPSPSSVAPVAPVEPPITHPTSAFVVSCDEVFPIDRIRALVGSDVAPTPYSGSGAHVWSLRSTALLQDGALACEWRVPGSHVTSAVAIVLDDASVGFQRSLASFLEWPNYVATESGEGVAGCSDAYSGADCHWNVQRDGIWLSLAFMTVAPSEYVVPIPRERPDTSLKPLVAVTDGASAAVVDAALTKLVASPRAERPAPSVGPRCQDLASSGELAALGGAGWQAGSSTRLEDALYTATEQQGHVMWAYSFERLGYTQCRAYNSVETLEVIVAPGAGWVLDYEHQIRSTPFAPVAGVGDAHLHCAMGEGGGGCGLALRRDGDVLVSLDTYPGTDDTLIRAAAARYVA